MKTKYLKLFERYYNQEMSEAEKEQFEQSLESDKELNSAFREYLSIYEAIGDLETLDLRKKLKDITDSGSDERRNSDFFKQGYNWFWMAALVIILVCITTLTYLLFDRIEKREQFMAEYNIPVEIHSRGLENELTKFDQRNAGLVVNAPGDTIFINREGPVVFSWYLGSYEPLILDLINQQGRVIYTSGTRVTSPHVVPGPLPGGMIVYRLRTEKEFYHMGFIFLM